ncbi:1-(5-phosphoribosyl)-5-[(5-phosphoribosylamino)methylideneamino]imidazole-4-carboxamide isomerase [bacterium]|nr:1-(5-phosphoribosyl)-5-[(5-phosphoribosylamino)methylideneamino]imidazole-4-carboxamide isomerase [bacterium]
MLILPAIDLSDGKCVRLKQGDMNQKTVFSDDPAQMAVRWADAGAQVLHLVDLDGAMVGRSANLEAVERILKAIRIPVELGGGLRTRDDVARVLDLGVKWAIMGTSALSKPQELKRCLKEFGDRITVGIDARDGRVAVQGWTETSDVSALDLARKMEELGVRRIIFTDIATDGMLAGPNVESTRALAEAVSVDIIASGGVTTLNDLRVLKALEPLGVVGAIVGRALYSGTIDLAEAIAEAGS